MINSLEALASALNTLYPTNYSHFTSKQEPPFIVYIDDGERNGYAENQVVETAVEVRIELYTTQKDLVAERKIKQLLNQNELPYEKEPTLYIEEEALFLCTFVVEIIE